MGPKGKASRNSCDVSQVDKNVRVKLCAQLKSVMWAIQIFPKVENGSVRNCANLPSSESLYILSQVTLGK